MRSRPPGRVVRPSEFTRRNRNLTGHGSIGLMILEGYGLSGAPGEVYRKIGMDVDTLVARALKFLKR